MNEIIVALIWIGGLFALVQSVSFTLGMVYEWKPKVAVMIIANLFSLAILFLVICTIMATVEGQWDDYEWTTSSYVCMIGGWFVGMGTTPSFLLGRVEYQRLS